MPQLERPFLLDTSVLLAFLRSERGQGYELASEQLGQGCILSVNLVEVVYDLMADKALNAGDASRLVTALGVPTIDFTEDMAAVAAGLRRRYRDAKLSTGDACCLAAAKVLGLSAATKDALWLNVVELDVVDIWPTRPRG